MFFHEEYIQLSDEEEQITGGDGRKTFAWEEIDDLHGRVNEAYETELSCEFNLFEALRRRFDSITEAFDQPDRLQKYQTYRLGQMVVSLDGVARVQ